MSWVEDLASLDVDGSGRRGDLVPSRVNSSCDSGAISSLPGIYRTNFVGGTSIGVEDFSKTNRSLVLREANVDGVHGSVLGTGRFASLCICHAWVSWSALPPCGWNS